MAISHCFLHFQQLYHDIFQLNIPYCVDIINNKYINYLVWALIIRNVPKISQKTPRSLNVRLSTRITRLPIVAMNDYRHFATGPYSRGAGCPIQEFGASQSRCFPGSSRRRWIGHIYVGFVPASGCPTDSVDPTQRRHIRGLVWVGWCSTVFWWAEVCWQGFSGEILSLLGCSAAVWWPWCGSMEFCTHVGGAFVSPQYMATDGVVQYHGSSSSCRVDSLAFGWIECHLPVLLPSLECI